MIEKYKNWLIRENLAANTVESYLWTIAEFFRRYDTINKATLLEYKGFLIEHFKPQTVNLRLQALNRYLEFIKRPQLKLKFLKVQQKNFHEIVISNADYNFLKNSLKRDNVLVWYFVVWYLGATGARVSELVQLKIEHVNAGHFDLYSKGGKIRRLYNPKT